MIKRCPFCDKPIATKASACPHCERPLQEVILKSEPVYSPPVEPPIATQDTRYRRAVKRASIMSICIACLLGVAHRKEAAQPIDYHPTLASTGPYRTTAAELYANYTTYETAIRQKLNYAGIELSGTIKSISLTMFAEPEIHLAAGADSQIVVLTLQIGEDDAVDHLAAGESVTIRCDNMSRILAQPTGQNCRLVD